jgi:CDP-diacylglycerol--inositol 3-phosphatidyltransferase
VLILVSGSQKVLFLFCAFNELFFLALYLLCFSSPILSPSLLQPVAGVPGLSPQPRGPAHPSPSTLFASPWSPGALELARANKMDSFWPWVIAGITFPVMAGKQFINVVQLVKAAKWLAEGDIEARRRERAAGKKLK